VFGVSFQELMILAVMALLVLGPHKLPGLLRTLGAWVRKLRRLTTEVRQQSGIDDVLRAEGFDGGLNEVRSLMRGGASMPTASTRFRSSHTTSGSPRDPFTGDHSREYPLEGPDAGAALPEDLVPGPPEAASVAPLATSALPASAPTAGDAADAIKPPLSGALDGKKGDEAT
jgi:sec-independent protein translocase protein TatB